MPKATRFSEQFQRQVAADYLAGLSREQIKKKYRVWQPQLYRILAHCGVKMRPNHSAEKHIGESLQREIVADYEGGLPVYKVAKKLHVHPNTVRRVLSRRGIPLRITRKAVDPKRGKRKPMGYWQSIDLVGQRFGMLSVIALHGLDKGHPVWECLCDCGATTRRRSCHLVYKTKQQSCGCMTARFAAEASVKHGYARMRKKQSSEYRIWSLMIQRCENTNNPAYNRYGGRGIYVCAEWHVFTAFLKDMGARPSPSHTLDRIDNDGPYSPQNCRWATYREQNQNRHNSMAVTFNGETLNVAEWARRTGIPYFTLRYRIRSGWPLERALTIKPSIGCTHPLKFKARQAIALEVKMKRMPSARDCLCDHCGKRGYGYHHHRGYDRQYWLDVIPLCRKCHDIADHSEVIEEAS